MKRISLITLLVVFALLVGMTVNATGLSKDFKNCEISSVDDLYLGKKVEKVWTLSYSPNETPVTVVKTKNAEGTNYIVRSEFFEVNYVSGATGFGVTELKRNWCKVPKKITKAVIDQNEMQNQKVLTPNKVDDEFALGLIANYLPDLLNDDYTHLLN